MARITEYSSSAGKLNPEDVVYIDGEEGSRKITARELASELLEMMDKESLMEKLSN